ncbi:gamma-glutamylcyclotransferase [Roseomonas sp. SSH11]|uniref:Gamma-glutamylcyclotransferase n=2 Tax=Pararoseomonas baculiformis TaxID=2820812 RepID=A0ABS4AIE5_9PROT|nr:gamma-glutamylcyclotransferase [Pararoseomonas baculiformis]
MRPASLPGFTRGMLRGTPYPTLLPCPGARVEGMLIRPVPRAMVALKRYEGACYRLLPVRVMTARGPLRARAWIVPGFLAQR